MGRGKPLVRKKNIRGLQTPSEVSVALEASDDCQDGTSSCALNALQLSHWEDLGSKDDRKIGENQYISVQSNLIMMDIDII